MTRVNYYFTFFLLYTLLLGCQNTPSINHEEQNSAITAMLQQQVKDWNSGDIPKFMDGYEKSDSLQFITPKGRTTGWQQVKDRYLKSYPDKAHMGTLAFKNLNIKNLSDSVAQVYGNWELQKDSVVGGHFSLIVKGQHKNWKIIIDHTW
jgi:hypothetical protein